MYLMSCWLTIGYPGNYPIGPVGPIITQPGPVPPLLAYPSYAGSVGPVYPPQAVPVPVPVATPVPVPSVPYPADHCSVFVMGATFCLLCEILECNRDTILDLAKLCRVVGSAER